MEKLVILFSVGMWLSFVYAQDATLELEEKTLYFYKHKTDYALAAMFCKANKFSLAIIKDSVTQYAINRKLHELASFFVKSPDRYWAGGKRMSRNNTWYWEDGSIIPIPTASNQSGFSHWRDFREYSNFPTKCLTLMSRSSQHLRVNSSGWWKADSCTNLNYFICQSVNHSRNSGATYEASSIAPSSDDIEPNSQKVNEEKSHLYLLIAIVISTTFIIITIILFVMLMKMKQRNEVLRNEIELNKNEENHNTTTATSISYYEMASNPGSVYNPASSVSGPEQRSRGQSNLYMEVDSSARSPYDIPRSVRNHRHHYVDMRLGSTRTVM